MQHPELYFKDLVADNKRKMPRAICSVCSSNSFVIEAAFEEGRRTGLPVLLEATANQINQFGGYTGMQPKDFIAYIKTIAEKTGFDTERLMLGGDHLGPLVWCGEAAEEAMKKAEELVALYAAAGFDKIHLDCSMHLGDDDPAKPLDVRTVAQRAARLAKSAEAATTGRPVYVIGSEVPIPGGATEKEDALQVTTPADLLEEYETFKDVFCANGLADAWDRVIAIVVQPGVEFGDDQVFLYNHDAAEALIRAANGLENVILEGHSTDYQPPACLAEMKKDGVGILKVGPALTFAVREALFALEAMEKILYPTPPQGGLSSLSAVLEDAMLQHPANWNRHYRGDADRLLLMRRFSLSDRCRYYMERPEVSRAIEVLIRNINEAEIPLGLMHQYMPRQAEALIAGQLVPKAENLIKENVCYILRTYQ